MDDPRIEWIRDRVYNALDIKENEVFEELLEREDGEFERNLGKFLNDSPEEGESSILFYKIVKEEEEEVEVECGMYLTNMICLDIFLMAPIIITGGMNLPPWRKENDISGLP